MKRILSMAGCSLLIAASSLNAAENTNSPATPRPVPSAAPRFLEGFGFNLLTEEQRASLASVAHEQQGKLNELQAKIRIARKSLLDTGVAKTFDEAAVRQQAQNVANLEAELTVLRLKVLSQVQPPLSPEQVEKIRTIGQSGPAQNYRLPENRPGRQRILQNSQRDQNDLPPKR